MSRLTRNQEKFWGKNNYKGEKYIIGSDGVTSKQMCLNKLGKLEDLEEEIGFSLEKLTKINHIYATDCKNVRKYEIIGVNFKEKKIWFWDDFCPMFLEFGDYKKQFWLKEDKSE